MRTPHLRAAATAVVLLVAGLTGAAMYAQRLETRYIHTFAPQMFAPKNWGVALQRAAFRQPDLLPVYGSSELNIPNRYHASAVFREHPTDFAIFPIGSPGSTSLIWLQALAAVGADLRGKKVVVSVPARAFAEAVDRHAYAANFSLLHASELAFSTDLGFAIKQAAARRMLEYPESVASDPLLAFALERLADDSLSSRVLYYASMPLGKLHNLMLRLQDHWETLAFLRAQVGLGQVARSAATLDWAALLNRAEQETRRNAEGTRFGFEKTFWAAHALEITRQKGMYAPAAPEDHGTEWADFDLALRVIRDLGGTPLILSRPMNGAYADFLGIPASSRQATYARLRQLAKVHDVAVVDFADHESDEYFTVDPLGHLSGKGWVYYDHALDAFFHDRKPDGL